MNKLGVRGCSRSGHNLWKQYHEIPIPASQHVNCQIDLFPMGASDSHLHFAAQHYSALTKLSIFVPSCLQTVNPTYEAFASALYPHSPVASEAEAVIAAYKIYKNLTYSPNRFFCQKHKQIKSRNFY